MSWTEDPYCEQTDAFAARSWNVSYCPFCKSIHQETGFFFTPAGLEDKVVRRARSDGARGLFLVPCNPKAPFFVALKTASRASMVVEPVGATFTHVKNQCVNTCCLQWTLGVLILMCGHAGRRPHGGRRSAGCGQLRQRNLKRSLTSYGIWQHSHGDRIVLVSFAWRVLMASAAAGGPAVRRGVVFGGATSSLRSRIVASRGRRPERARRFPE